MRLERIPVPPSVNNLFANARHGGRFKTDRYRTWATAAGWEVKAQKPERVSGPVSLTYTVEDGGTKADLGNVEKPLTDLLVSLNLIDGDGPSVVRAISLQWGSSPGVTIDVRAA